MCKTKTEVPGMGYLPSAYDEGNTFALEVDATHTEKLPGPFLQEAMMKYLSQWFMVEEKSAGCVGG